MKACFSTLGCPDWTTRQILAALRGIGFAGLEVRGLEGEMNVPASPHLQPGSDFLRGLADSGCRVAVLGSSASFSRPDEALEECRAYVLAAAAIGCPIVRVFGGNLPEGRDRQLEEDEEGCLSLPQMFAEVTRPARVKVRYTDLSGARREIEGDDLLAACLQHEIDHLDGVLFVDHLSALKRNMIMRKLAKEQKAKGR